MALTKKKIESNNRWVKENYDSIYVRLPKGAKEMIKASGETYNGFMIKAFNEYCERHGYKL